MERRTFFAAKNETFPTKCDATYLCNKLFYSETKKFKMSQIRSSLVFSLVLGSATEIYKCLLMKHSVILAIPLKDNHPSSDPVEYKMCQRQ